MASDKLVEQNTKDDTHVRIDRQAYDQVRLDTAYDRIKPPPRTPWQHLKSCCRKSRCDCSVKKVLATVVSKVPIINTLRGYALKKSLAGDIIAGLSVGVMHIPQGMGFAILAGVPPVYGLYSSFWPVLIYALFGTGHHVGIGTMALISLMINSVVEREIVNFVPSSNSGNVTGYNSSLNMVLLNHSDSQYNGYNLGSNQLNSVLNRTIEDSDKAGVLALEAEEGRFRADVASSLSLIVGLLQFFMGILRLGIVSTFMPSPFVGGFTSGAAIHVITSQIKFLLGVKLPGHDGVFRLPYAWVHICKAIPSTNPATVTTGIICIIVLILIKTQINDRFRKTLPAPVPAELLVVIIACVVSYLVNFSEKYHVKIVKHVPRGMPPPSLPSMSNAETYIVDAFIISVVSFSLTYSMGSLMGSLHGYTVGPNQEMSALGLAHTITSFFNGFAGTAAPPRCFVLDGTGGKTLASGLITSAFLLLVIFLIGPLFAPLPNSVLAAIIIVAILPLFKQFTNLPQLWKVNKYDFFIWVITCVCVTFLDIGIGLGVGIIFAIASLILNALRTKMEVLGSMADSNSGDLCVPINDYANASEEENVKVIQFQGDLNFVTKDRFKSQIQKLMMSPEDHDFNILKQNTELVLDEQAHEDFIDPSEGIQIVTKAFTNSVGGRRHEKRRVLIIDMSRVSYIDVMGIATLKTVQNNLTNERRRKTEVYLCCVSMSVLKKLENAKLQWFSGKPIGIFPTIADARAVLVD